MSSVIGAALAALAGLAIATGTVIGVVQSVKSDPGAKPTEPAPAVAEYGQR